MIITNRKNLINLSFLLFFILLAQSCHEEVTACLDITASNYNAAADNECPENDEDSNCECLYNQLTLDLNYKVDSIPYSLDQTFVNDIGDSISIREAYILFSNFTLKKSTGTEHTILEYIDLDNDGTANETNDVFVEPFSGSSSDLGNIQLKDTISEISFRLGLIDTYNDATLNYTDNEDVQELIDSSYFDANNKFAFLRLSLYEINNDTVIHEFEFFDVSKMLDFNFVVDTLINYDDNVVLELDCDLDVLFKGVDLSEDSASDNIIGNLIDFIRLRE